MTHDTPIYPLVIDVDTAMHNARCHFKEMEHVYVEWIGADAKTISIDLKDLFNQGDIDVFNEMYDRYRAQLPDAMAAYTRHVFNALGIETDDQFEALVREAHAMS